ncbi:MAG: hypothetical protein IMZ61_05220, partial [Planctomycetes bacterium]|nr:hypothetical protein [Planctomycetota bacterium]
MLGKRHFLCELFLTFVILSGLRLFTIYSSANGSDPWVDSAPNNTLMYTIGIPIVLGSYGEAAEAAFDLSIERIEVTQAVQDLANSVPLVSGRQTVVRVYVRSDAPSKLDGIRVMLAGAANGHALT